MAIDNNAAENQLRGVALGRKNWLFAGSLEGAKRAALLYSLVQSCALIDVPPSTTPKTSFYAWPHIPTASSAN